MKNMKDIPGYQGIYAASDDGHIWSHKLNRYLSQHEKNGYYSVNINNNGINKSIKIHKLIAITFLDNPENKPTVDHIDRNKKNNNISNLRWATWNEQGKNKDWTEKRQKTVNENGLKLSRKIECRDKNDHSILINTFSSAYRAAIEMFNNPQHNSLIHRCAKGQKNSAYGYWWCYADE